MKEPREIIKTAANEPVDLAPSFDYPGSTGGRYPSYREGSGQEGFQLFDYWRAVRKRLWLVIGIAVLVTTLTAIYMARKPSIYQATSRIQVDLEQNNPDLSFSSSAMKALFSHSWPGNIRELRNVVLQAAVMVRGAEIHAEDLAISQESTRASLGALEEATRSLDGMERRMIMDALAATNGHQQRAADRLGISRRTLSRKLKLYESESAGAAI